MASRIFNACDLAGKPFPFVFNHSQFDGARPIERDGLVHSPHVKPEVQVQVLALVDATDSPSLGDCIHALEGLPAPLAAILDMAKAGYLDIEAGVLSQHLAVSRGRASMASGGNGGGDDDDGTKDREGRKPAAPSFRHLSPEAARSLEGSAVSAARLSMKLTLSPLRADVFVLNRLGLA